MANVIGEADIVIRGDASEFTNDLNKQTKPAQSWGKRMGTLAKKALRKAMKVGIAGIGVAAGAALIGGFKTAVNRQQAEATLAGLYGSADKAKTMMKQLRDATVKSPIEYTSYLKASEALAYAGVEGKSAVGVLKNVGKAITATGGGSEEMERATDAILKMVNNGGKANLQMLQQLSNTGLPVFDSLAKKFGKGTDEISRMASAGKISVDDVVEVLEKGTGDILKSQIKSSDKVEKTWGATWKAVIDQVNNAVADGIVPILDKMAPILEKVGGVIADAIGNLPETIGKVVDAFKQWAPVIGVIAGAFVAWNAGLAVHKGLLIADMVIKSQWLTLTGLQIAAINGVQIATRAMNAAWKANPLGMILTAVTLLVGGLVLMYNKVDWFRDAVDAAWAGIKKAVSVTVEWFTDTVGPALTAVWDAISGGVTALYEQGIKPAWDAITGAIGWAIDFVKEHFEKILLFLGPAGWIAAGAIALAKNWDAIWDGIKNVISIVADAFVAFYEATIKPVFDGIMIVATAFWDGLKVIFDALVAFFDAVLKPAFQIFGEVVRVVFQLITGIIQIWWAAVKIVFKAVVTYLKNTLGAAFKWFRDSIIKPVWNGIQNAIKTAWNFIKAKVFQPIVNFIKGTLAPRFTAFKNTISNVWSAIKNTISTTWNKYIKPVFTALVNFVKNQIQKRFNTLKSNVTTVWNGIKSLISSVWNKGIKPIFLALVRYIKTNIQQRFTALKNTVTSVWNAINSKIKGVWKSIKSVAFDPLAKAVKTTLPNAFRAGKNAIGKAWDKVRDVAKKPVKFVISTVLNGGIIKGFNKIASKFGVKKIAYAKLPAGFDSGGWTGPGRKLQPAGVVHADEYVLRKAAQRKITRRHGRGVLDYMNATGNLPGHSDGGMVPGYAGGGMVWNNLWAIAKAKFPWARLTSAYRPGSITASGNQSYHSQGKAVDLAGRGSMNMGDMMKIFNFIHKNYGQSSELIHSPAGKRQIKNGRHHYYTGAVRRMHFNHVHWANKSKFNGKTAGATGGAGGGGGFDISAVLDPLLKPFKSLKKKVAGGVKGAGAFGSMIGKGAKKMIGMPITWIKDNISKVIGDVGGAISKGVDFGKGQAWALARGVTGDNKKAMNWIVSKESGWNHKAKNPSSTASGLPQFINATSREYLGGAPARKYGVWKQLDGMRKYVKDRYGGWLGAQRFWKSHNYYDKGGFVRPLLRDKGGVLPPGMNLVNNATGKNEYVLPPKITDALMNGNVGGGDTYINVELSVDDLDGLQSALQFVEMLKRDKKTERVRTRMTAKSGEVNA